MQLLAVSLARLTAFTDIYEWNPQNNVPMYEFSRTLTERYRFLKSPQTLEEFDLQKGVTFQVGTLGAISIISAIFYTKGVVIDTRSSTEDANNFLRDMAEWAEQFFGIEHSPNRINRKTFLSELSFYSEVPFDLINPKLRKLAAQAGEIVSSYAREPETFELSGISFVTEPPTRLGTLSLRIERLSGNPFWENKYFSSAPLPTPEHLALLTEFESILKE